MRNISVAILLFALQAAAAFGAVLSADLDGDGSPETVWIKAASAKVSGAAAEHTGRLCVGDASGAELFCSQPMNIWKLMLADADSDGRTEIVTAVSGTKKERAGKANGLHIHAWNGEEFVPVWRGSALSMPYRDAAFHDWDSDGRNELISLEVNPRGHAPTLVIYEWRNFGFAGETSAPLPAGTQGISLVSTGKDSRWTVALKDGKTAECSFSRVGGMACGEAKTSARAGAAALVSLDMDTAAKGLAAGTE